MASESSTKTADSAPGTGDGETEKTTTETPGTGSSGEEQTSTDGTEDSPGAEDLSAEVEKWKSLSRKNEKDLRSAQSELEKIKTSQMSEQEQALAAARAEGAREVTEATQGKLIEAEIRAAAAGVLADPADALALIGVGDFVPEGDGEIDSDAIAARVAELVKEKPYLAATQPKTPPGKIAGGAREGSPKTFTRTQLRDPAFYEAHQEEILKAARDGRIVDE